MRRCPRAPPACSAWSNDVNFLSNSDPSYWQNLSTPLVQPFTLPPELAQLQHLEELSLHIWGYMPALPAEWGQPGSFPGLLR